ncbi:ATP-dependent DNA helicase PIF1-like protein [Tanacetum coccineum]|uniref:ATP-dependent DNA helicase n=1 Tax=Tanacetum coccineum TaxID=301880 RepID=A0ABQ5D1Y6_9ASTR
MRHVDADSLGVFFIDGPGGTRKTFLYKALLAIVHSRGLIALATASAANNMTGGRTAHSRFKIPINLTTNSICNIKKQSGLAKLLCQAKLIIWDEASMAKRHKLWRRNLDLTNGSCNCTRLICKRFDPNVINAEITVGQHTGVRVLLPRIPLAPSEEDMYGYIRNHKKTIKNKQARIRERKSEQKPEAKLGKVKPSVKVVKSWREALFTIHSSLSFHQAVKARGKWKLKGENGNSSGPLNDGKVRLVISKLSLSSLKLGGHVINGEGT